MRGGVSPDLHVYRVYRVCGQVSAYGLGCIVCVCVTVTVYVCVTVCVTVFIIIIIGLKAT